MLTGSRFFIFEQALEKQTCWLRMGLLFAKGYTSITITAPGFLICKRVLKKQT